MKRIFLLTFLLLSFSVKFFGQNQDVIKIGVFVDLTGQTWEFGQATKNGIELAAKEINDDGGINGKKIHLIFEDDQGRPETAQRVVKKLVSVDKVDAVLGEVASTNSLAAAPVAQAAKIPMISSASTNPKVTEIGDYIFRACFVDPFQGEAMAKFAFNQLKLRRVAILYDVNSDYSKGLLNNFKKTFTASGGKIINEQSYTQNDPDFKAQLKTIRKLKPDAMYIPGYYGQTSIIAKQARQLKMNFPLLGGDGWDSPEIWKLGGNALKNSYITNHFASDNSSPAVKNFVAKYSAKFGSNPDSLAALAYDTMHLLAGALKRANSTDGKILRDALAQTKNFEGVTGRITRFDESRNAIKPVIILKLQPEASRFVYHATIEP